jgi:hypothetical protein
VGVVALGHEADGATPLAQAQEWLTDAFEVCELHARRR